MESSRYGNHIAMLMSTLFALASRSIDSDDATVTGKGPDAATIER